MYKILVLEDDELFASTVEDFLSDEGFEVDIAFDGEECLELNFKKNYDLYIFDINVPKINGLKTLENLRGSSDNTPTIFLTSYKDKDTLKDAFLKGCDDYLKKPVDLDELILRIKAIFKRENKGFEDIVLEENLIYNKKEKRLYKDKNDLKLPIKVLELLELFIENEKKIISKDMIVDRLWSKSETHSDGSIRVYINSLKNIFEKKQNVITNIKGIGYRFEL